MSSVVSMRLSMVNPPFFFGGLEVGVAMLTVGVAELPQLLLMWLRMVKIVSKGGSIGVPAEVGGCMMGED